MIIIMIMIFPNTEKSENTYSVKKKTNPKQTSNNNNTNTHKGLQRFFISLEGREMNKCLEEKSG